MKIAFASCSKIHKQKIQPAWKAIARESPDLLLLLGDNVYGGTLTQSWKKFHKNLESRYQQQFEEENFRRLTANVPFKAIWDDHDFAKGNDGKGAEIVMDDGGEEQIKKSRDLFHRYMNCSTNLPEVYYSFTQGKAKFIMLDVRFYREDTAADASILGKKQEDWLEQELKHSEKYTIVCSGSCLTEGRERWEYYQKYYKKFNALVAKSPRVLFLAGDIHRNQFTPHQDFYEVVSSAVGRNNRNNYGIIELGDDTVTIRLRGRRSKDNIDATIDSENWSLVRF